MARLETAGRRIAAFAVSSDGRWLATGSDDNRIRIWDVNQRRCVRAFAALGGAPTALWFDPQRRFVLSLTDGRTLRYWQIQSICQDSHEFHAHHLLCQFDSSEELDRRQTQLDALQEKARKASASGDCAKAFAAYQEARKIPGWEARRADFVELLDGKTRRVALDDVVLGARYSASGDPITALASAWDGSFVVAAGKDGYIRVWGRSTESNSETDAAARPLLEIPGHVDWVRAISLSPNNRYLVSGAWDSRVRVWDLASGKLVRTLDAEIKNIERVTFAPDGRTIAVGTSGGAVSLWDGASGRELYQQNAGSGAVLGIKFRCDGRFFATATDDGAIRLWSGRKSIYTQEFTHFQAPIRAFDFTPDFSSLVVGCANGKIYRYDLAASTPNHLAEPLTFLSAHSGGVVSVSFLPDGEWVATTGIDRATRIWNARTGAEARRLDSTAREGAAIAFDLSGRRLFLGDETGGLKRWDLRWNYAWPNYSKSPAERLRLIATLANFHLQEAQILAQNISPRAYYGVGASPPPRDFSNENSIDAVFDAICADAQYRGLGTLEKAEILDAVASMRFRR
ncbi:MAG: hypothetical protein HUK22_05555 [Thermoguttaceae bacterium]|nr:hypothetical protein [Thermoguttaceae bacterium]